MKKSLIGLASLQAAAALAAPSTSPGEARQQPKLGKNHDALALKPIVTKKMKAGTQQMLKTGEIVKRSDLNPVSLADRKNRDVPPIHIGGDCSDIDTEWPNTGVIKRSIPDGDGIQLKATIPTLWRPAQFGKQHAVYAHAAAQA